MLHENPCDPFQLMMCIDGDGITGEGKTYGCLDVATTHQNGVGTCWNQAKSGALTRCTHQNHIWTVFKSNKMVKD
jgi:hypothetical protein